MLETAAVGGAVPALSQETLATLEPCPRMPEALAAQDVLRFADLNRRFHFTLYEASGLKHLTKLISLLWNQSERYRSIYFLKYENLEGLQQERYAILRACQAREAETAVNLLDKHRRRSEDAISDFFHLGAPDAGLSSRDRRRDAPAGVRICRVVAVVDDRCQQG